MIFVSALIVSRDGQAENNSAKEREARTACLAGDYTLGVRQLSELFVSTQGEVHVAVCAGSDE